MARKIYCSKILKRPTSTATYTKCTRRNVMTRLITKQMRDSFQCKRVEMTMLSFYQGGEPCFEEKAKKQRILILKGTIK